MYYMVDLVANDKIIVVAPWWHVHGSIIGCAISVRVVVQKCKRRETEELIKIFKQFSIILIFYSLFGFLSHT